jgi:DNA-binding beta-propeller fold protein YncE
VFVLSAVLAATIGLVWSTAKEGSAAARPIGTDRIVAWESLPDENSDICEVPARPSFSLAAASLQEAGSGEATVPQGGAASHGWSRRTDVVAERQPLRVIADPYLSFSGITVDPSRDEVVVGDQKMSKIVVYDRLANTPPTAAMTAPKRVIGGERSFLEYVSSVYVDPPSGDIFAINNDTMLGMPVFGRDAIGDVAPKRRIERPHTSFAIAASEKDQELFLTIQDDHAVVIYRKDVKDKEGPTRIIQGSRTGLADPHGIAVDSTRNEIFVANWGQRNERPPLSEGGGGGYNEGTNFPVGRTRVFPASGKIEPASITVYPVSARGDAPPVRVIKGPKTQLNWATALAVHPDRGELFVANDVGDAVTVFRTDASGDVAPIRVIKGPRSLIKNPTGVAVDLKNNELWVANFGGHSATVYPITAQGDAPPLRVIRSAPVETQSPMLSNPHVAVFDSKRKEILVAN